ncbi:hypothetical protein [Corallococcus sp. CA049B]|uniref:hypothetical protein n=1 Tax=Corallococcus sp. CA049B TaxID=2316730 RepID=UPI0011C47C1F|nr:hypothetical protein [Corallococcus sp. CA049B]
MKTDSQSKDPSTELGSSVKQSSVPSGVTMELAEALSRSIPPEAVSSGEIPPDKASPPALVLAALLERQRAQLRAAERARHELESAYYGIENRRRRKRNGVVGDGVDLFKGLWFAILLILLGVFLFHGGASGEIFKAFSSEVMRSALLGVIAGAGVHLTGQVLFRFVQGVVEKRSRN